MFVTFVLGVLAGWFAKQVEPRTRGVAERVSEGTGPLDAVTSQAFALAVALLIAAFLAAVLVRDPSPVALTLGGCLGVLGPRLQARWQARKAPDYDS